MPKQDTQVVVEGWMKRLERMAVHMEVPLEGVEASKEAEEEVDMNGWSEYDKGKYNVGKLMVSVRDDIKLLDAVDRGTEKMPTAKKAAVNNRVRKNIRQMKLDTQKLKRPAGEEGRLDEYDDLLRHLKRTEKLNTDRFRNQKANGGDDDDEGGGRGFDSGAAPMKRFDDLDRPQGDLDEPLIDPAEDEEFQQFYRQTRQNDEKIEEGLKQLNAGLGVLKQNAVAMQDELQLQNRMLDDTNKKAEDIHVRIQNLNQRMDKTLKEVEKDKFCCYAICLLVMLGVLGVLASQFDLL